MDSQTIVLIFILILSMCYGAYYGFFKVLRFVLSIFLSILLANNFFDALSNFLPFKTLSGQMAFFIIFFVSNFFLKSILKFLINPLENFQGLKVFNRLFGSISMIFFAMLILGIICNLKGCFKNNKNFNFKESKILTQIYEFDKKFYNILPLKFKQDIYKISDLIFKDWKQIIK